MRFGDIDPDFPVAGQDNESEGFRVNFSAIYDSLEYTDGALATLADTTLKTGVTNDVNFGTLENVRLVNHYENTFRSGSAVTGNQTISYLEGSLCSLVLGQPTTGSSINLSIEDFPAAATGEDGRFAKIRVELTSNVNDVVRTVTFTTPGAGGIKYDGQWPLVITTSSTSNPVVVEFWSWNGGATVYAKYIGVFGEAVRTSTFENLATKGNATFGNSVTSDVTTFNSVLQLPITTGTDRNNIVMSAGMVIYNASTNSMEICKARVDSGSYVNPIAAYDMVAGQRYVIISVGGTDFIALGASANAIGVSFTASGAGANIISAGTVRELVWTTVG